MTSSYRRSSYPPSGTGPQCHRHEEGSSKRCRPWLGCGISRQRGIPPARRLPDRTGAGLPPDRPS